ncbi:nucleotide-binding universal stress UspA family protein [Pedobacter sp. AK017]|uniref:universal stress protein n=1 Tax=Pedobacter sp. AK017 TaxID=2723073 RepID=UPI00161A95D7|nr:universal stress protein [Pedobacter sp. AK017]MBB5438368.1 nucleotide-binding universal stress UspA family protein [Pedobacter sp. AK017]
MLFDHIDLLLVDLLWLIEGGNTVETFSVEFKVGSLELEAIVTAFDYHRRFKVEFVTNEDNPIILLRSEAGEWKVEQPGQRTIPEKGFQELGEAIDKHLDKIYSIKNILVLVDFSAAALNAARYAAAITTRFKTSSIILYHSVSVPLATDVPLQNPPPAIDFQTESIRELNKLKKEIELMVADDITVTVRCDERPLAAAVNILAEQLQLGLVVMGTTGKSNLEKIFIGSNAVHIADACRVPLLIVPKEAVFADIQRVLFACDLKKVIETIPTRPIKTLIHALNAKLYILNVAKNTASFNPDTIAELAALHRLWDDEEPEYHYTDHEDLVAGIMEFASEQQIQLLVTVPRAYGFFEGLFHRSLTSKLAYHTNLPLLLFREDK